MVRPRALACNDTKITVFGLRHAELFQLLVCTPRSQFTSISREVHDSVTFIVQINPADASNGKNGLVRTTVTPFKETAHRCLLTPRSLVRDRSQSRFRVQLYEALIH